MQWFGRKIVAVGGLLFSKAKAEPFTALRPARVLVVDDDRDVVLTLMMLLREEGHDVRGAHSGRDVMRVVADFDPDVVILDIHLPERSGWQLARDIREGRGGKHRLLVGISGQYRHGADRVLSELIGFDHYLLKPYAPADLLKILGGVQPK